MKLENCCMCNIPSVVEITGEGARRYCPQCGISTSVNPIEEWANKEWNALTKTTKKNVQKMVDRSTPKIIKKRLEIAEEIIARDNAREAKAKKEAAAKKRREAKEAKEANNASK